MATRHTRASHAEPAQSNDTHSAVSEHARQQLIKASEMSCMMCRAAEAMQQIHQHMTQRAALRYQQMADQMRKAHSPAELMAIQSGLLTAGLQETARYMQDMTAATLRMQGMLMNTQHANESADLMGKTATAAFSAWQSALTGHNGAAARGVPH